MDFIAIDNALFFRPQTIGIFLTPPLNISCGYSSESPRRGDSDEDDNICFNGGIRKISTFSSAYSSYLVLRVYSQRHFTCSQNIFIYSFQRGHFMVKHYKLEIAV